MRAPFTFSETVIVVIRVLIRTDEIIAKSQIFKNTILFFQPDLSITELSAVAMSIL